MTETFKSKWGYHPCSKETYLKLKKLNKLRWETVTNFHSWLRWARKEPHNRITGRWIQKPGDEFPTKIQEPATEPRFCKLFVNANKKRDEAARSRRLLTEVHVRDLHKNENFLLVEDLYNQSRFPNEKEVAPFSENILKTIDMLIEQAEAVLV